MKKTHIWGLAGVVAGYLIGKMGGLRQAVSRF